jgi:hypothetical protein
MIVNPLREGRRLIELTCEDCDFSRYDQSKEDYQGRFSNSGNVAHAIKIHLRDNPTHKIRKTITTHYSKPTENVV